jgi:predicted O-methyltransferase YrrM
MQVAAVESSDPQSIRIAELLATIYQRREVTDAAGNAHRLHSEVTPDEGHLIASLISANGFVRTLEVGCAYGLSTLHVCGALASRPGAFHTIIDPGQSGYWKGIGVHQLARCGFTAYELIEQPSEFALPDLLRAGRTFQFAVIDGWHTFDHTMLDFFYVNRLLEPGGIFVIDDLQLPGIRKVARYISNYPNYRVVATAKQSLFPPSLKRKIADGALRRVAAVMPASYQDTTFDATLFKTDFERGLISEMVAFQKIGGDDRDSHWFQPF